MASRLLWLLMMIRTNPGLRRGAAEDYIHFRQKLGPKPPFSTHRPCVQESTLCRPPVSPRTTYPGPSRTSGVKYYRTQTNSRPPWLPLRPMTVPTSRSHKCMRSFQSEELLGGPACMARSFITSKTHLLSVPGDTHTLLLLPESVPATGSKRRS